MMIGPGDLQRLVDGGQAARRLAGGRVCRPEGADDRRRGFQVIDIGSPDATRLGGPSWQLRSQLTFIFREAEKT